MPGPNYFQNEPPNMNPTKKDSRVMQKIAERAMEQYERIGVNIDFDVLDIHMDLAAVHLNGCPLRLGDLLTASGFDFFHDIGGIRRHLNRETGTLENCFVPRYAK